MVYSYKHGFSGFAAKVTESQAQKIAGRFSCLHWLQLIKETQFFWLCGQFPNITLTDFLLWSLFTQSYLELSGLCPVTFILCKQLGVGIILASLLVLPLTFCMTQTWEMELSLAFWTQVALTSLSVFVFVSFFETSHIGRGGNRT